MPAAEVVIYTTPICAYCIRAKMLLSRKNVVYQEINVLLRPDLREWIAERSGQRTVPQIFVNGASLGGFVDIAALDRSGELDKLLSRPRTASDPAVQL
jgi:glutaredoxin 3